MPEFWLNLQYWHWIGLAALIFIVEMLTGTGVLVWLGSAAIFIALILFLFPMMLSVTAQWVIFSVVAIVIAVLWKFYLKRYPIHSDNPTLNRRSELYIGRVFTLESPIVNGMGKIHVDDSMWRVRCDTDLPVGSQVEVIKADGVILIVNVH